MAAVLLDGGRTAHSMFKIPIPCTDTSTCNVSIESRHAETLVEAHLIIWDEIVMCHRCAIEAVSRLMRDLCRSVHPFGGKVALLSGDFRQILPVIPGGTRNEIIGGCFKNSNLYENFENLTLDVNMRLEALRNDPNATTDALEYPEFLLKVGEGRVEGSDGEYIPLPSFIRRKSTLSELIDIVFGGISEHFTDVEWLSSRVIMTLKNLRLRAS